MRSHLIVKVLSSVIIVLVGAQLQINDVQIDSFIPEGMPIELKISLDKEAPPNVTKYVIQRIVSSDVDEVHLIVLKIDLDNLLHYSHDSLIADNESRIITNREWSSASSSWNHEKIDVRRLIIIVDRVETDHGVWLLDNSGTSLNLESVINDGKIALPKAKFIPKQ